MTVEPLTATQCDLLALLGPAVAGAALGSEDLYQWLRSTHQCGSLPRGYWWVASAGMTVVIDEVTTVIPWVTIRAHRAQLRTATVALLDAAHAAQVRHAVRGHERRGAADQTPATRAQYVAEDRALRDAYAAAVHQVLTEPVTVGQPALF